MERLLVFSDSYCNGGMLPEELKYVSEIDRIEFTNFTFPLANQCTLNVPQTYSPCNLISKLELPNYCSKMENIFQSPKQGPNYSPLKESIKRRRKLDEYLEEREKLLCKKYKRTDFSLQRGTPERVFLISPKRQLFKTYRDEKRVISEYTIQKKYLMAEVKINEKVLDRIHLIKNPMAKLSCLNVKEEQRKGLM
ncbi:hypothetical protein ILUMI_25830 [Ignelater luminosus]|uniref:Uncharacterized protein n=1 Tax=Ignelater luminosus TaxID=2038154 RepID=A0A8K0C9Q5_IGNLU|nr:hypothetical protein ILUMI_25830 [Ignelater luminosus]